MSKTIGKYISKSLRGKYSQKLFGHTKQSTTAAFKTVSKKAIQETTKTICDLIGKKIADKITDVSRDSSQNSLEIVKHKIKKYLKKDIYFQKKDRRLFWSKINII